MSWAAAIYASAAVTVAGVSYAADAYNESEDNKNRPQYKIPIEYTTNLTKAERKALEGLPPEVQKQWVESNRSNLAANLNTASQLGQGLGGVEAANRISNANMNQLGVENAAASKDWEQLAMKAREGLAEQNGLAWQLNELNPYYEHIARRDARNRNLQSSLMSTAAIGGSAMGSMGGSSTGGAKSTGTTKGVDATQYMGVSGTSPSNPEYKAYNPNETTTPFMMQGGGTMSGYPNANEQGNYADTYWLNH